MVSSIQGIGQMMGVSFAVILFLCLPKKGRFLHDTINLETTMNMNNPHKLVLFFSFALVLLSACSSITNQPAPDTGSAETQPTPVTLPTQLSVQTRVDSQTCLVAEKVTIQTDKLQGNLMAWSPVTDGLAIVQPVNQYSGWYIGDVLIFDAAKVEEVFTSEDQAVFGDLTWSPDGSALAYIVLDQQEAIYTVKILTLSDGLELDIFGSADAARTNDFASLKGIREWSSESNLIVVSSCGTDCVWVYQYNPVSLSLLEQGEIRQNEDPSLLLANEMASPDGQWLLSEDDKQNLWLSSSEDNQVSLLLTATEAAEIKWSKDSSFLALRTADLVKIYELGCNP